jgi:hypothetical protein
VRPVTGSDRTVTDQAAYSFCDFSEIDQNEPLRRQSLSLSTSLSLLLLYSALCNCVISVMLTEKQSKRPLVFHDVVFLLCSSMMYSRTGSFAIV